MIQAVEIRLVEGELPAPDGAKFLKMYTDAGECSDEIAKALIESIRLLPMVAPEDPAYQKCQKRCWWNDFECIERWANS